MAYYIIYFNGTLVVDVVKYSENEYDEYLIAVARAKVSCTSIQYGYF